MWNEGENNNILILDMDGTIADTYNYPDWAGILRGHVANPWTECGVVNPYEVYEMFVNVLPMITCEELEKFCSKWDETVVWSMAPWDATPEVEEMTVRAKLEWLQRYFPFLMKNVIITKHQDNKNFVSEGNILYSDISFEGTGFHWWSPGEDDTLVDDNETLLRNFIGKAMTPPWLKRLL